MVCLFILENAIYNYKTLIAWIEGQELYVYNCEKDFSRIMCVKIE